MAASQLGRHAAIFRRPEPYPLGRDMAIKIVKLRAFIPSAWQRKRSENEK